MRLTLLKNYLALFLLLLPLSLAAKNNDCRTVKLSDIGWTDITATTAVVNEVLLALNYEPQISLLSLPVTLAGLKNKDVDVFLGNWMPTQEADIRPYLNDGSMVQLSQNLEGAVYTLAVPEYVHNAGVKNFADLKKFSKEFKKVIYGVEPGNDGNRLLLKMIKDKAFGLGDWQVKESSEQGMLTEVKKAIKHKEFIVFLGWAPHPMNLDQKISYLAGGDAYFGPNMGASKVFTLTRKGFAEDCPNLNLFFSKLKFSLAIEAELMSSILTDHLEPKAAAKKWLRKNRALAEPWLLGVKTYDGTDATKALSEYLDGYERKKHQIRLPLGNMMENGVLFFTSHFSQYFRGFSVVIEKMIKGIEEVLLYPHWGVVIALISCLFWLYHRSFRMLFFTALGLLLIVNLGLWQEMIQTLILVSLSSFIAVLLGVPLGIVAARYSWFYSLLRPILDLMQTIPTFVYLIPTLMLFGLGVVPGLISTIIFAISAPIRLTYLGIKGVPHDLIEASDAFGASKMQRLFKVELPFAYASIMAGLTQCIMLSLSMVVIAALVGAEGLGTPVVRALNTVNIAQGFEAGLAIVILAVLLDRSLSNKKKSHS